MTEHTSERRLTLMEAQVSHLSQIVARQESASSTLSTLERSVLEVRGDVKSICAQLGRLQKDHDDLERTTEASQEESKKAVEDMIQKFLAAFESMVKSMKEYTTQIVSAQKEYTTQITDAHGKKLATDIEPRLKAVETRVVLWAGGIAALLTAAGLIIAIWPRLSV